MKDNGEVIRNKRTGEHYILGYEETVWVNHEEEERDLQHLVIDINHGKIEDSYISKEILLEDYEIVGMEGLLRNIIR